MKGMSNTECRQVRGGGRIYTDWSPLGYITVPDWVEEVYEAVTGEPD